MKKYSYYVFFLLIFMSVGYANHVQCGNVVDSIKLDDPVTAQGTCFTVQKDGITIDCAQHSISYATQFGGYGITTNGHSDVTIRNCFINGNTTSSSSWGVWVPQGKNIILERSTIMTNAKGGGGIYMEGSSGNKIRSVRVITYNENSDAVRLVDVNSTFLFNDVLNTFHPFNSHGVRISGSSNNNVLRNLFFNSVNYSILDETSEEYVNYLRFSNNYGEIHWIDNGTGSFPRNLTFLSNKEFGLGNNLVIGQEGLAVNTPIFGEGKINSGVILKLNSLPSKKKASVDILKTTDYIPPPTKMAGESCLKKTCSILSYNGKRLRFNSTTLGSFMVTLQKK